MFLTSRIFHLSIKYLLLNLRIYLCHSKTTNLNKTEPGQWLYLIKLSIQISFNFCVFMFLYKRYAVVVFMFIMLYFVYFVCYSNPLCLKQASSFLVRLHSRSSQSAKKLNYFLSQFIVSQQNSMGRKLCLFNTPPGLRPFKPPTK